MDRLRLTAAQLELGSLLAEGGEGRVYTLAGQPEVVYKAYRRPPPRPPLEDLVNWLLNLDSARPEMAARVRRSTAWPISVVMDSTGGRAAGLLMPRAPQRFSLRHREGPPRLATLSYLTTDPAQRAAAYGLRLPEPVAPVRLGVVYALARLLEATQAAEPAVAHGDLSGKNVLWSLAQGPEVFVLDCDSSERFGPSGRLAHTAEGDRRRRAMTPNWDDPAVPAGGNPGPPSDRYSLALIFLRVVGAAHYPLQRRQREGQPIAIDFEIPSHMRRVPALASGAALWDVCQAGLQTTQPELRPSPATWAKVLEDALQQLGGEAIIASVRANQSGEELSGGSAASLPSPADATAREVTVPPGDVTVRPVVAEPRARLWSRTAVPAAAPGRPGGAPVVPQRVTSWSSGAGGGPPAPVSRSAGLWPQVRAQSAIAAAWWLLLHRRMIRALATSGRRRRGARRLAFCVVVDLAVASVGLFLIAMLVSPFLGI